MRRVAVDAWLGRQTRHHGDVDIAVFEHDQHALFRHLTGWDLVAHDANVPYDSREKWNGRKLDLPADIHANSPALDGTELDIQLNANLEELWLYSRDPCITHPVDACLCAWAAR